MPYKSVQFVEWPLPITHSLGCIQCPGVRTWREIAHEGRGPVIFEPQEGRGIGLIATLLVEGIALDVSGKRVHVPEGD